MKKELHPNYVDCKVTCSCGNAFETRSTKPELRIDLCNKCHPFFTGQQKFIDTGGRVQRFSDRFGSAKETVAAREADKKAQRAAEIEAAEAKKREEREAKAAEKAKRAAEFAKKAEKEAKKAEKEASAAEPATDKTVEAAVDATIAEVPAAEEAVDQASTTEEAAGQTLETEEAKSEEKPTAE